MDTPFRHPVSIAPMMRRTDRHFRYMMRCISHRVLLYTEMVTAQAVLKGDRDRLLDFSPREHPVALQLGGDDPTMLAECAAIAEEYGYDEVNLNVGCPSQRVQSGNFGACLMRTPTVVAESVRAMRDATRLPVTVKHRIGVDDQDDWQALHDFVETVADAGCRRFTVHARKAWLQGLSPRENRNVPPLKYDIVYRLKEAFDDLVIELNGHVATLDEMREHLRRVDAVMIGRAAYDDPWLFAAVDEALYGEASSTVTRDDVALEMATYASERLAAGDRLPMITRHMLSLFTGQPGSKRWRQHLTTESVVDGASAHVIVDALGEVRKVRRAQPHRRPARRAAVE